MLNTYKEKQKMANEVKAKYSRKNSAGNFVVYHFETDVSQVKNETTTKMFFDSTTMKVNGESFYGTAKQGITLTGGNINFTGTGTYNYITKDSNINTALAALDSAAKAAAAAVPSGVLTTSNYTTTLNSVYQAKDANLTAIAGLTGTSGLLKKTAANTWTLDTTTYATPSDISTAIGNLDVTNITGFGAGKTLSALSETDGKISATFQNISITKSQVSDFPASLKNPNSLTFGSKTYDGSEAKTIYATDVKMSSSDTSSISDAIQTTIEIAEGKTKAYVINTNSDNPTISGSVNSSFNVEKSSTSINVVNFEDNGKLIDIHRNEISLSDLKVGDIIFTTQSTAKDWWYAGYIAGLGYTFRQLDSDNPDLSGYASKSTTLSGYGITDAYTKNEIDNKGYLTSHQSLANYVTKTGSEALTNKTYNGYTLGGACAKGVETTLTNTDSNVPTSKAVKTFVEGKGYTTNTGTITEIKINGVSQGTSGSVNLPAYPTVPTTQNSYSSSSTDPISGKGVASALSSYRTTANRVYVGSSAPTDAQEGDVWIQTA